MQYGMQGAGLQFQQRQRTGAHTADVARALPPCTIRLVCRCVMARAMP